MNHYPFFVHEAGMFLSFFLIVPAVSIYLDVMPLAVVSPVLFVFLLLNKLEKVSSFRESAGRIEGLKWNSKFYSLGTLILDYCGKKFEYYSNVSGKNRDMISVRYFLKTGSKGKDFIVHGNNGVFNGDVDFLKKIRKEVVMFDNKYEINYIQRKGGMLELSVILNFRNGPAPPNKMDSMAEFLRDFLDFALFLGKKIK